MHCDVWDITAYLLFPELTYITVKNKQITTGDNQSED